MTALSLILPCFDEADRLPVWSVRRDLGPGRPSHGRADAR